MNNKSLYAKKEEELLDFWDKNKIFEKSIARRKSSKIYSFYDGPPFATGLPHYGHILASTIKDVVPRYWTMKGYRVPRRWGWDCHGLPIENIIEKDLNINSKREIEELGIDKFNAAARETVLTYAEEWKKTIRRIARFVDFDNSYKTMDNSYIETVWWIFSELGKKGLLYEDTRISLYCPRCSTPLSNFEIAMDNSYKDVTEKAVAVKLLLEDEKNTSLLAWTTTPWTLIGNVAAAVNSKLTYVKVKSGNEVYILAKSRLDYLNGTDYQIEKEFTGKELVGKKYKKLYQVDSEKDREGWYVIAGDFVSAEEGTGVVHLALYGEDDYKMAKKYNLPFIQHIGEDGKLVSGPKDWLGMWYKKLDPEVIKDLQSRNLLFKAEDHPHSYPFCYRCETPLYYALQPAWFVNIGKIRKNMLEANKKINWKPEHLKNGRFGNGLKTAPDWNLSRSRYWGSPMPIWRCEDCGGQKIAGSLAELNKHAYYKNNFFLLRHGEATHNLNGTVGPLNELEGKESKLSEKGIKQIEKAAKLLKKHKIDVILASDVYRIKQTAEIVSKELGKPVKFYSELRELNNGSYQEATLKEFHALFNSPLERFQKRIDEKAENLNDLKKRMLGFIRKVNQEYNNQNILVIGHGDPLWILEAASKNLSDEKILSSYYIKNGEVRKIKIDNYPYDENGNIDIHRPYIDEVFLKCQCGGKMARVKDVFDCWFESGSMPYAEKHFPFENKKEFFKSFPTDFVAEYIAQTRGWFYTLHVISTALFKKPAFKNAITTGTILAETGEKMSKSKKNYPDPWMLFDKYGVDSLRYYLMTSPIMMTAENINFSEQSIKEIYNKVISTIENVGRFFELYKDSKANLNLNKKRLTILDSWIISRIESLVEEVDSAMQNYEVTRATRPITLFVDDLSNWYLRRSRRRFQRPLNKKEKESATSVLAFVLLKLSKAIAMVTPFVAEDIYQKVRWAEKGKQKKLSVHLADFPAVDKKLINKKLEGKMAYVRGVVALGLKARVTAGVKVRQPLAELKVKNLKFDKEMLELVKDELNVQKVSGFKDAKELGKEWVQESESQTTVALNTALTPELEAQGLAREVVRQIQEMRKEAKYNVNDVILMRWSAESPDIENIFEKFSELIKEETITKDISEITEDQKRKFDLQKQVKVNGKEVWIGIAKVN